MRDRISSLNDLIIKLSKEMKIENLIVTRGSDGSILYNKKKRKFIYGEAYASKVIDKIGAGDTMLSVISLCLKSKIDIDLSLIISSLAAAQSVENLANKDSISKLSMLKTLENILK
jgi:bifunctional ADP-heptose synthase (sugar kinase/adenylyltransferase)